jgi:MinD-like ATPase involved in chromosome partitioning or flagellar assembly
MGRLIAVCGKGGKSTIATNLAYAISDKNVTLIFDTKFSCSNVGYMLSTPITNEYNLNKIILSTKSGIDIKDGITQHKNRNNLFILSVSDTTNWLDLTGRNSIVAPDKIKEVIFELKNRFDYIVVDCEYHPGNLFSLYSIMYADKIINVFSPDVFGIAEINSFSPFLRKFDNSKIINVANADRNFIGLSKFENLSGLKIDISLSYEFKVQKCSNQGVPIMATTIRSSYVNNFKELIKMAIGGDTFAN